MIVPETLPSDSTFSYEFFIDLAKTADVVAVDTESGPHRGLLGISFAFTTPLGKFATYMPYNHDSMHNAPPQTFDKLWDVLKTKTLVFHHAGHDLLVLEANGFFFDGPWYCTMIMCHWIGENDKNFSLDACSRRYGGQPKNRPPIMQFIIEHQGWDKVPIELMLEYSSHDAFITLELFEEIKPIFDEEYGEVPELWEYEKKFILLIARMVDRGIRIDPVFSMKEIIRGEAVMSECRSALGFNPGSPIALEKFLLQEMKLPIYERTPKGKPSFNKKAMEQYDADLERLKDPRAKLVLTYRGWQKTISANYKAYLHFADEHGILHPGFKIHGPVTSRLSCEKPALHQIPRETEQDWNGRLKQCFIGREGFGLWEADEAQLEFRLGAAYSQEPLLLSVFNDPDPKRNLFREMSEELGWEYNPTKTFNYSTMYGGGVTNTSRVFGVSSARARILINQYYKKYPALKETQRAISLLCKTRGWVRYWSGRRRHFIDRYKDAHKAFNSVIQGGAAELVKRWMIRLEEEVCDENCRMVLQVHDSVVFEIRIGMEDEYIPRIRKIMEEPPIDFGVNFRVDIHPFGKSHAA